jgi:hypothetical protein
MCRQVLQCLTCALSKWLEFFYAHHFKTDDGHLHYLFHFVFDG